MTKLKKSNEYYDQIEYKNMTPWHDIGL